MSESRVLVVDDEPAIVRLCQRFLERAGFEVVTTTEPRAGLELLRKEKFDLLLVDIRMPEIDGFELIAQARQYQPELAVLVMTGFGTVEIAIQALRKGVDGLILKPFESGPELIESARQVIVESKAQHNAARMNALRPLFDVSEAMLSETNMQPLANLILNTVSGLLNTRYTAIYVQQPNTMFYDLVAGKGQPFPWERSGGDERWIGRLAQRAAPMLISRRGPGEPALQELLQTLHCESVLAIPVKRKEEQYFFLAGRVEEAASFTESDLEMLAILARQAAVALENAGLYSDLRDYVRRVEESQRALVQAEKMAAIGRLMASVSHEINNPLQSVRNCLHLADRKEIVAEQRKAYLEMARSELNRLAKTVQSMLEFSKVGRVEREAVELEVIMHRVLNLLKAQLDHAGVQVKLNIPKPLPIVSGLPDQLQQVFLNLIINAADAMEEMPSDRTIWIDLIADPKQVVIFVEDSGIGIPQGMELRIFEPFVSTKKEGTGLGLSVSYGIVEAHGGQISVINPRYGTGACFEIDLPV
jgi:signal transduction histidine kinase